MFCDDVLVAVPVVVAKALCSLNGCAYAKQNPRVLN